MKRESPTFSGMVRAARKLQGISQEKLAEQLKVSRQTISLWERGTAIPRACNYELLAEFLGIDEDALKKSVFKYLYPEGDYTLLVEKLAQTEEGWKTKYTELERKFLVLARRLAELEEERMDRREEKADR